MKRAPNLPVWAWAVLAVPAFFALNWLVQAARKPSEVAGLVLPTSEKSPEAAWRAYGSLYEDHATEIITPELLAALAQLESGGDPAARTYWRWSWTLNPLRMYAPASSAVGLFQLTDGTFARCRSLCVRDGQVREAGPWHDWSSCWLTGSYNRLVPSHSVELTAACLHRQAESLAPRKATLRLKQDLAAVSHLCGPASPVTARLAKTGRVRRGARCGDHDARAYLDRIRSLQALFARLRRG